MKQFYFFFLFAFLMPLTLWAEEREYTDTEYHVNYTYDTEGTTAIVKRGNGNVTCGSPEAKGDIVILEKISVNNKEYIVTSIGCSAFVGRTKLTNVSIPSSIKTIETDAFMDCYNLEKLILPEGVESIDELAFSDCNKLSDVIIPSTITSIGLNPFFRCRNLQSITVAEGNTVFDSRNNCNAIIETATGKLISGCNSTVLPSGIKSIAWGAFDAMSGITNVVIPEGVTSLEAYAYAGCSNLENVVFPESLEELGWECFDYCTKLTSITLPKELKRMGDANFISCTGLTKVIALMEEPFEIRVGNFSTWGGTFTSAALYVPVGCVEKYRNTSGWNNFNIIVPIGTEVGEIQEYTDPVTNVVYTYYEEGTTASLKAGMNWQSGSPMATGDIQILSSFTVNNKTYTVTGIGSFAFVYNDITSITIPASIRYIGSHALYCQNLQKITMLGETPADCNNGDCFYYGAYQNVTLSVPEDAVGAYWQAPGWSEFLTYVEKDGIAYRLQSWIEKTAWVANNQNVEIGVVNIPAYVEKGGIQYAVTGIDYNAFDGNMNIKSIVIPATMTELYDQDDNPFSACFNLQSIQVHPDNPRFCSPEGYNVIIEKETNTVLIGCKTSVIPDYATAIGRDAFHASTIEKVIVPASVQSIGNIAFGGCNNLRTLIMKNPIPCSLDSEVFEGILNQYNLFEVVKLIVPKGSKSLYQQADVWKEFKNIEEYSNDILAPQIYMDSQGVIYTLRENGSYYEVTGHNESLASELIFPSYLFDIPVTRIANESFAGCEQLVSVEFPVTLEAIGGVAFGGCPIAHVVIPKNVREIQESAFSLTTLESIKVDPANPYLDSRGDCNAVIETATHKLIVASSNTVIPDDVLVIGAYAFAGSEISSLILPDGLVRINQNAFRGCQQLKEVFIPASVTNFEAEVFLGCQNLEKIHVANPTPLPVEVNVFDNSVFQDNYETAWLIVPDGTKQFYMQAEVWKKFFHIYEESELAGIAMSIDEGQTAITEVPFIVPVKLENKVDVTAFQLDIKVEEGLTIKKVSLTERATADHRISWKNYDDGSMRVVVYSPTNKAFANNEDAILNIQLQAQKKGQLQIQLTNIEVTDKNGNEYILPDVSETIMVSLLGDANCDGHVTITDVTAIINHILGDTPTPFNPLAADVSQNGKISITDVVQLINKYLFEPDASTSRADSRRASDVQSSVLALASPIIIDDHTVSVNVVLDKQLKDVSAFQFDMALPEDVAFDTESLHLLGFSNHDVIAKVMSNGVLRIVCYSMQNNVLANTTDGVLSVRFNIDNPQEGKVYTLSMENIELSTSRAEAILSSDMSQTFVYDNETLLIGDVAFKSNGNSRIYKLNGQRYTEQHTKKGTILIKDGKKYFK